MRVIAHRGASGDRPEHTLPAYALALEQGAGIVEPDLVFSADGVLVLRHDLGLRHSTDIAERRTLGAGEDVQAADLTLAELRELRCLQPWPQRGHEFDRRYPIPTFAELLDLLEAEGRRRGRQYIVYPECKHAAWHRARGHDFAVALAAEFGRRGWSGAQAPVGVHSFEHDLLAELKARTGVPTYALLEEDQPVDPVALRPYCDGLGLAKARAFGADGQGTALLREAKALGFRITVWTVRHDRPNPLFESTRDELRRLRELGVDAVFCDFPGRALADLAAP